MLVSRFIDLTTKLDFWGKTSLHNYMERADFLYFEVEAPMGLALLCSGIGACLFFAKIRNKIKVRS